jgi:hypothetical protein
MIKKRVKIMNNKGVITRGMAILAALILIIIIGIIIAVNVGKSTNVNKYKDFEKELVTGAQNYYEIKNLDIDEGEEKKISLKTLSDSNLVYSDLKDKCSGYVIITNEEDFSTEKYKLNYNAYIKCGRKYMTANYSEY